MSASPAVASASIGAGVPAAAAAAASSVPSVPSPSPGFTPLVTVVGFHHARGPEVETWFGAAEGLGPAVEWDWSLLPFMALSDGAHASEEDFSYFTLLRPATAQHPQPTSLFGISCTRQLDASRLLNRPADVTRSTVQKAVVVIADSPQTFGMLRQRLSVVTQAWFAQRDFTDVEILKRFQESLDEERRRDDLSEDASRHHDDQYLGMSLRELVREFKWQTLVLLKCCLLQPKMLFFGSRCDRLCMVQFSLISLIPGLLRNLQDCADPDLNSHEATLKRPSTLRTSDRSSLLTYMGLPLQLFGKGSLFGPYTPLQQLDVLADFGTRSYMVGSTNSLLLQQRDRYSDMLVNLDEGTINITSASLRNALALTTPDRRWIDYLTGVVNDTWDDANPGRPKTLQYVGSEEFIRLQFEEYILSLLASVKYRDFAAANPNNPSLLLQDVEGNPAADFGADWVEAWYRTENHRIWDANTDSHLFDIVEPKHPCAGGLTIDDVSRRVAEQVKELRLDERFAQGREVLGRNFAIGRERASGFLSRLYADVEGMRETRARAAEESRGRQSLRQQQQQQQSASPPSSLSLGDSPQPLGGAGGDGGGGSFKGVDLAKAQQTMQSVGNKAGAYVSSWAAWAAERRKQTGWGAKPASSGSATSPPGGDVDGGGWGFGTRHKANPVKDKLAAGSVTVTPGEKDYQIISTSVESRPLEAPGPTSSDETERDDKSDRKDDGEDSLGKPPAEAVQRLQSLQSLQNLQSSRASLDGLVEEAMVERDGRASDDDSKGGKSL